MAEKDSKPKKTVKADGAPSAAAPKGAAKPAATVKPAATAKPTASTTKPAAKTAAQTKATSSSTAKPAATTKPTASTTKPAAKTASTAKPAATKPAEEPKKAETKKAAPATSKTTSAPKTSGNATSAAAKQTAAKPEETVKPAAKTAPAAKPATKTAATKPEEKSAAQVNKPVAAAAVDAPKGASTAKKVKPAAMAKTEKPEKQQKPVKSSGSNGETAAAVKNKKIRFIIMAAVAFVLILALIIGIVVGTKSCNKEPGFSNNGAPSVLPADNVANDNPIIAESASSRPLVAPVKNVDVGDEYDFEYSSTSAVGFSGKVLDTIPRVKPVSETMDERDNFPLGIDIPEGSVRYPKYGYTMSSVLKSDAARAALINESDYLSAYGTRNNSGNGNNGEGTYNMMDKDGYLYFVNNGKTIQAKNFDGSPRQLYKHSSADGMYFGGINAANPDIADDEPGIVKQVTIRPRGYGSYSVTGVYAPAGEVIKIEMSEADMNATGGITIHIGQALYNGQSNNIWVAKGQMQRLPNILNTMVVNKSTATLKDGVYTAYVGSFIGGPLYIRNTNATFTATISGGVRYSHFILGYTTKEEYEENKQSTTPYFDLEVWNYGVLHSGPKLYAQNFSYDDIYKAAVLWEKVSSVTTTGSNQGIVFLYDPFVAAGAAVAFPGRSSVNCPTGWMSNSLNYNTIVSSGGWGNFHEYHHNFQGYGVGNGGEVTNNGMTLVSYALFTKISAKRGIGSFGGQGLGGWNNYTSATWALNDILSLRRGGHPSNGDKGLTLYSVLLHNFGANNYIQAKYTQQKGGYGQSYAGYFRAWEAVTHNNMSYYFKDVLKGLTSEVANKWHNPEYTSMFVPVSCVYQTGRSYLYDGEKKYFQTMQPYVIPYGTDFNIDLSEYTAPNGQYASGSIVIPDNFKYRIKSVTKPEHGTIEVVDNYNLKFKPDTNKLSGQIIVTLEIVEKSGAFKVDDVDLVLEFEQSHETNKMTLERTTYTYTEETAYTDAQTAFDSEFTGYTDKKEYDHSNPVQNANTDIWAYPDNEQSHKDHPTSPEHHFASKNKVDVIDGKLYFESDGKYRIYLRGRVNCAVYFSLDGQEYKIGAKVTNGSGSGFYTTNANTYFDVHFNEGNVTVTVYCEGAEPKEYTYKLTPNSKKEIFNWLYVKEVMIVQSSPMISYIGLGMKQWTQTMFTMEETYHKADNSVVESPDEEGYAYTKTIYRDYQGNEVAYTKKDKDSEETQYYKKVGNNYVASTAEEVSELTESKLIAPTSATYVNAYRKDYEFPDNSSFESDYFYNRVYKYNYTDNHKLGTAEQRIVDASNMSLNTSWGAGLDNLAVILDGVTDSGNKMQLHSSGSPSEARPFTFIIDLGKVSTANRFVLYSQGGRPDPQFPSAMNLYASIDGENFSLIGNYTDLQHSGNKLSIDFDETEMRYYKFEITKSTGGYIIIREVEMWNVFEITNGTQLTPDNGAFTYGGNWQIKQTQSTFGHVYVGGANATMAFKFNGTRLGLLSSKAFGKNFEITIDGKKVTSLQLKDVTGDYGASFISELFEDKEHTVVIKCLGEANIDSVVIFK